MDWIFWLGTTVFVLTYILIATEKVHKVICALAGAALMFIFVLHKGHGTAENLTGAAAEYAKLDAWARHHRTFPVCGDQMRQTCQGQSFEDDDLSLRGNRIYVGIS